MSRTKQKRAASRLRAGKFPKAETMQRLVDDGRDDEFNSIVDRVVEKAETKADFYRAKNGAPATLATMDSEGEAVPAPVRMTVIIEPEMPTIEDDAADIAEVTVLYGKVGKGKTWHIACPSHLAEYSATVPLCNTTRELVDPQEGEPDGTMCKMCVNRKPV